MTTKRFRAEIYAGHTTDCGAIVPFDASIAWKKADVLPIGYRKLAGYAVRGEVDGAAFESWVFLYHRQWRLIVPGHALAQAELGPGDEAAFTLRLHPKPESAAKFEPGPKRPSSRK